MKRHGLLVATSLCLAAQAQAFSISQSSGRPIKWTRASLSYWLDADGSVDISGTSDLAAVRRAVAAWNEVSCSSLAIEEAGTVTSTDTTYTNDQLDGKNLFVWIEDARWRESSYVLGVTTPVYDVGSGFIEEADISFNGEPGRGWRWSVNPTGDDIDVESVAVHEIGHYFGMQHVLGGEEMADPPTMSPYVDEQLRTRTLTADDARGACFLYPVSPPYQCASDEECPYVIDVNSQGYEYYVESLLPECVAGTCVNAGPDGGKALGETCVSSTDCAVALFCQALSAGESYCSQSCDPQQSGSCPDRFTCVAYSDASAGACLSEAALGGGGCGCDTTTSCDSHCDCDPECDGGCAALPGSAARGPLYALLIAFFVLMFPRALRRRGGAR